MIALSARHNSRAQRGRLSWRQALDRGLREGWHRSGKMKMLQLVRMPPLIVRRRLVRDTLLFWLAVRLAFPVLAISKCRSSACVFEIISQAPAYLPERATSMAIVCIVILMSMVQVRRLGEIHFLRNLGIAWPGQVMLAFAVAGALELAARGTAILLVSPVGAG